MFESFPFETRSQVTQHEVDGKLYCDLHNSVFMNFTRMTAKTVGECYNNDMQFCRMRNIIESDYDVSLLT